MINRYVIIVNDELKIAQSPSDFGVIYFAEIFQSPYLDNKKFYTSFFIKEKSAGFFEKIRFV